MTETTLTQPTPIALSAAAMLARTPGIVLRRLGGFLQLAGRGLEAMTTAYAQAIGTAYSLPFQGPKRTLRLSLDEDLEGRDPNW